MKGTRFVFPRELVGLGCPETVWLSPAEVKALHRFKLGGAEGLRTPGYSCACKTIDSLVRKGLLESLDDCTLPGGVVRRGGMTFAGKQIAETFDSSTPI